MFKKILIYSGYVLLFSSIAAYFYFSSILTDKGQSELACKTIKVAVLDSADNSFITNDDIIELLRTEGITANESKLKHINGNNLETLINNLNSVLSSQVSYTRDGVLRVDIRQRKPILRIETPNGGFYMDANAYFFPLVKRYTSYVPVVSGSIPLKLFWGHKGKVKGDGGWSEELKELGLFLEKDEFWKSMVVQIYIDEKGIVHLTPRIGEQEIIFGHLDNIEYKFSKLYAFYKEVVPVKGWDLYSTVDIQYSTQIVCKKRKNIIIENINI